MHILVAYNVNRDCPTDLVDLIHRMHQPLQEEGHVVDYLSAIGNRSFSWQVYRQARRALAARFPYDIITVTAPDSRLVTWFKGSLRSRIVLLSHELMHSSRANPDHVLCVNEEQQRYVKLHYAIPNEAITRVIPGAAQIFANRGASRNYGTSHRLLLAVSWKKDQSCTALRDAVTELMRCHPELELRVLGRDIPKAELLFQFPEPLQGRIHLLTAHTDAENAAIMADSDILILTTRLDESPRRLVEAMASGLPIVTLGSGMRSLVEDGWNGLVTSITSATRITEAVERLMACRELRETLGINARREAASRYTWAHSATTVQESYQQVLTLHPPDAAGRCSLRMLFAVHVSRDADTAVYKNTRERVAYLEKQGCHCTIVAPEDFPWTHSLGSRLTPILFPLALAWWLLRRAKNYDVATFHSYAGWAVLGLKRLLRRFRHLRTVIQLHGLEPLYYARLQDQSQRDGRPLSWRYRWFHGRIMLNLLRRACRWADMVLCLNSEEYRFLVDQGWASNDRVHLVANPAPDSFFLQRRHRDRATRLLFVGQWLGMKGTESLVGAFARLHREYPHLRLLCAGTLMDAESVLRRFPPALREYVTVFPRVSKSELLELHRNADIFAFPTISEGFSLALIEAMASGLPIVTTPVGAAPDILQDGSSVVFCPSHQAQALAEAVLALVDDRSRREHLGGNAQRAAEAYRPQAVWRDYASCLNQLAGRGGDNPEPTLVPSAEKGD